MTKIINSPIFITLTAIASLFVLRSQMKPTLATEIRGAYDEIIGIAQEAGSDSQKTQAIKEFATQIATQLREGFAAGFAEVDDEKESSEEVFLRMREQLELSNLKEVPAEWDGRQSFLFELKNNSDSVLSQIKVNFQFYADEELIDAKNEWISDIKALGPADSIAIKKERAIPKASNGSEDASGRFDEVRAVVTSFSSN